MEEFLFRIFFFPSASLICVCSHLTVRMKHWSYWKNKHRLYANVKYLAIGTRVSILACQVDINFNYVYLGLCVLVLYKSSWSWLSPIQSVFEGHLEYRYVNVPSTRISSILSNWFDGVDNDFVGFQRRCWKFLYFLHFWKFFRSRIPSKLYLQKYPRTA